MFKHLLVPLDGSIIAECTLPHLVAMAHAYQARVTLVRVIGDSAPRSSEKPTELLQWTLFNAEAKAYLDEIVQRLRVEADLDATPILLEGQAAQRICEYAYNNNVDLIIISSHGQSGLSQWNLSSVAYKVIQRVHHSIMIIRAYKSEEQAINSLRYDRILVPLDGSKRAEWVLSTAATLARFHQAQLMLSHVVVKPEMPRQSPLTAADKELNDSMIACNRQAATEYMEQLRDQVGYPFEPRLLTHHDVGLALHGLADEAMVSLVVLGAHGYNAAPKRLYGSITSSFIEYGASPLLVVQDLKPGEIELTEAERAATEYKGH